MNAETKTIKYQAGYKYQLAEDAVFYVDIKRAAIQTEFIAVGLDGKLLIKSGYAWDGPSGPALDTKNFMRGSLVHDALCQLIELGILDHGKCWGLAAAEMRRICKEDGMLLPRRWWTWAAVRFWGKIKPKERGRSLRTFTAP